MILFCQRRGQLIFPVELIPGAKYTVTCSCLTERPVTIQDRFRLYNTFACLSSQKFGYKSEEDLLVNRASEALR